MIVGDLKLYMKKNPMNNSWRKDERQKVQLGQTRKVCR